MRPVRVSQGVPRHCVLADAGYGADTAFHERLSELDLRYVAGVSCSVTVAMRRMERVDTRRMAMTMGIPTPTTVGAAGH